MKERDPSQRVVITGTGVATPLGLDEAALWQNLLAGTNGIHPLTQLNPDDYRTPYAGEVDTAALSDALAAAGIRPMGRTVDLALLAAHQALTESGLRSGEPPYDPLPIPSLFGTATGPTHSVYATYTGFANKGPKGVRPTAIPRSMANVMASQISLRYRLTGPNFAVVSACSSATAALAVGYRMIRSGTADQALCGGADAPFEPGMFASWNALGVMARTPDPATACRPFDADRAGCVLGEGAGALLLESLESARRRNATIRGELLGCGESSDAKHITSPDPEGQAAAIRQALQVAGIKPGDVDFINAHGTATRANDTCEAASIRLALGDRTDAVPVASNKSFFGHLLGACGAVETILTLRGLQEQKVPPNRNLDNPDPDCRLRFVGADATDHPHRVALKNSFGFGGNNTVLALGRWDS
jgi:3-oxoacyl-[acyl-carrier-protein] synthase II